MTRNKIVGVTALCAAVADPTAALSSFFATARMEVGCSARLYMTPAEPCSLIKAVSTGGSAHAGWAGRSAARVERANSKLTMSARDGEELISLRSYWLDGAHDRNGGPQQLGCLPRPNTVAAHRLPACLAN